MMQSEHVKTYLNPDRINDCSLENIYVGKVTHVEARIKVMLSHQSRMRRRYIEKRGILFTCSEDFLAKWFFIFRLLGNISSASFDSKTHHISLKQPYFFTHNRDSKYWSCYIESSTFDLVKEDQDILIIRDKTRIIERVDFNIKYERDSYGRPNFVTSDSPSY